MTPIRNLTATFAATGGTLRVMPLAFIVGAGIGGLSAGIALRRAGWDVRIVERAPSPRELGFGLGLAPNAIAALRDLGVAGPVLAQAFVPRRGEFRRPDGSVLKRAELPPDLVGGPIVLALRPALHGALLDAVGLDAIALGTEAVGVSWAGNRIALRTRTGEREQVTEADLLVGADGVASVVRRALHPTEPPPRSSGIIAVRGVVHGALRHLGDLSAVYYLGRGVESMLVRASDTGIYWYVSFSSALAPRGTRDPTVVLSHVAGWFDETFRAVTGATTDLRCDDLVDRDPLPSWGRGAVTLLGDAAHPLLPHTGQGAAQAIVDAVALGRALEAGGDVESALRSYERARQPRTATLLAQGRRTARVMRITNPVACALRDTVIRLMPIRQFAKIYVRVNRRAGTDAGGPGAAGARL
jgi:2-polyprenyl-6-methoxyphenol hydroxylase-like FAD-dependent oxidoreductase